MSVGRLLSLQQLTSLRLFSLTLQQQQQQQCQSHVRSTGFQSGLVRMFATGNSKNTVAWKICCFPCQDSGMMLAAGVEGTQPQEGSWMPGWLKSRLPGDCQQAACSLLHATPIMCSPILSELSAETLGGTKEPATDELDLDSKLLDLSGLA